jgi:hypothetical protein
VVAAGQVLQPVLVVQEAVVAQITGLILAVLVTPLLLLLVRVIMVVQTMAIRAVVVVVLAQ